MPTPCDFLDDQQMTWFRFAILQESRRDRDCQAAKNRKNQVRCHMMICSCLFPSGAARASSRGIHLWCLGMTPSDSLGTCLVVSASSRSIPLLCHPGVQQGNSPLAPGYDTVCLEFRRLLLLIYDDTYTLCSCMWQEYVAAGASFPAPPAL